MRLPTLLFGLVIVAVGTALALFVNVGYFSAERAGEPIAITVAVDPETRDVAKALAEAKLVPAAWVYDAFAVVHESARRPKAGTYAFRRGAALKTIADTIARGPVREAVTLRLIEGETVADEIETLRPMGVEPSAFTALAGTSPTKTANARAFDRSLIGNYPFLEGIPEGQSLEGYLFPDTYEVWKDALPRSLVEKQLNALESKVIDPLDADRKGAGLSWHEVLTLASIVEAEVRTPADRKIVAGIFLNRLKDGMRIQSDATLNYVIGEGRSRATAEDLAIDSPYNSYARDGLPPGPIGNPGFSAIDAVIHPTETDYYFFLTDAKGNVLYGKTFEDHQRNKAKAYGS